MIEYQSVLFGPEMDDGSVTRASVRVAHIGLARLARDYTQSTFPEAVVLLVAPDVEDGA